MSPEVGQMAPDFEAKIESGETIKLSDFKGKKSFFIFILKTIPPAVPLKPATFEIIMKLCKKLVT